MRARFTVVSGAWSVQVQVQRTSPYILLLRACICVHTMQSQSMGGCDRSDLRVYLPWRGVAHGLFKPPPKQIQRSWPVGDTVHGTWPGDTCVRTASVREAPPAVP